MTKRRKHCVTVKLSEEALRKIKAIAVKRGTTISELVAKQIDESYEKLSSHKR